MSLPSTLKNIGHDAFNSCKKIESIIIPEGVTTIESGAFSDCEALHKIQLPNSLTFIGSSTFYGCQSLTNITIPDKVESISGNAFTFCPLHTITMGAGIKKIDKGFSHRNLKKVIWRGEIPPVGYQTVRGEKNYVPNDKYTDLENPYIYPLLRSTFQIGNMRYVPTSLTEATCDILDYTSNNIADSTLYIDKQVTHQGQSFKVKNICPAAFYKKQGIKKLSINIEGIIGDMAFKNCSNLESLTINSLSSIGKDTFSKNTKLKHTSLNNHINSIGENAFEYCKSLQHFTIPDSVSVIERKVFQFCSSLEDIIIHKILRW